MQRIALDGQVVVVTGAGKGLGRAYAEELGRRGASVVVNDRPDSEDADRVVAEIRRAGGTAVASRHSVASRPGGEAIVADAVEAFGTVHALVNNAGILRNALFEDLTDEQIDAIIDVHVRGAFFVTQPAYRIMRANGYGRIVNVASNTAFGMVGLSNYALAKAGLVGLANSLALEGAAHGILVNSLFPNATTTIMQEQPVPGFAEDTRFAAAFATIAERYAPETIAPLVAYLVSPDCAVSGEGFSAMAGRYARVCFAHSAGWMSDAADATAEDVAEHLPRIRDVAQLSVPRSTRDEFETVAALVAALEPAR